MAPLVPTGLRTLASDVEVLDWMLFDGGGGGDDEGNDDLIQKENLKMKKMVTKAAIHVSHAKKNSRILQMLRSNI